MSAGEYEGKFKKYIWLHKLHVIAVLYVLFSVLSKLLNSSIISILFISMIVLYLIYPKPFNNIFPFRKKFYTITFLTSGGIVAVPGTVNTGLKFFQYIGTPATVTIFFIFFNSFFVLIKVLKVDLRDALHQPIFGDNDEKNNQILEQDKKR